MRCICIILLNHTCIRVMFILVQRDELPLGLDTDFTVYMVMNINFIYLSKNMLLLWGKIQTLILQKALS